MQREIINSPLEESLDCLDCQGANQECQSTQTAGAEAEILNVVHRHGIQLHYHSHGGVGQRVGREAGVAARVLSQHPINEQFADG